jgi:hypothetical protein
MNPGTLPAMGINLPFLDVFHSAPNQLSAGAPDLSLDATYRTIVILNQQVVISY